jgi:hypothetical protein
LRASTHEPVLLVWIVKALLSPWPLPK